MTRHLWIVGTALVLLNCTDALRLDLPDAGTPAPQRSASGGSDRDSSTAISDIEEPAGLGGSAAKSPAEPEPPAATCDGVDCGPHSTCAIKTNGRQTCACAEGFERRADACVDIDECARGIARCGQECFNTEGAFECRCEGGLVLDDDRENCRPLAWSDAQKVPLQSDGDVARFALALDAAGNVLLVHGQKGDGDIYHGWSTRYDVASGEWSGAEPVETLGLGFNGSLALALDDEGNGLVVWSCRGFCANRYTAGIGWGEAARSGPTLPEGMVAASFLIGMGGDAAVAVWIQSMESSANTGGVGQVFAAHHTTIEGWSTGEALAPSDGRVVSDLALAVVPDGRAAAAWTAYRRSGGVAIAGQLCTRDFGPDRGWGVLRSYRGSTISDEVHETAIALGENGAGLVASTEFSPIVDAMSSLWLTSHDYTLGASLVMDGQPLATTGDPPSQPSVSLDPSGDGAIVWVQSSAIYGRAYTRAGGFGSTTMVGSGGAPSGLGVVVNAHGDGIATWKAESAGPVWANTYSRDDGFGQALALGSSPAEAAPILVIDGQGRATVAWRQTEGDITSIWFARFE